MKSTKEGKEVQKKNNPALFAVGGLSVINILTCVVFGIILLIATISYFTHARFLTSIGYYITHVVALLLFGLSWLLMIIGGFSRKHGFCLAGTIILGGNFLISRLTNFIIDLLVTSDRVKSLVGISKQAEEIGRVLMQSRIIRMQKDLIPAILISLFFIAAIIILIVRCTPARGKVLKIIGTIFAVLTSISLGIAGIADIIVMNITRGANRGLTERIPYLAFIYRFFGNIANPSGAGAYMLEPLFFIILDIQIFVTLSVLIISAMASIPTKKEN